MTQTTEQPARLAAVKTDLSARFPELEIREGWSARPLPRVLQMDTIHMDEQTDYMALMAQVKTACSAHQGVTVGWCGAVIEVKVPRGSRRL